MTQHPSPVGGWVGVTGYDSKHGGQQGRPRGSLQGGVGPSSIGVASATTSSLSQQSPNLRRSSEQHYLGETGGVWGVSMMRESPLTIQALLQGLPHYRDLAGTLFRNMGSILENR